MKKAKRILKVITGIIVFVLAVIALINGIVIAASLPYIKTAEEVADSCDSVIIPGSPVYRDEPKPILKDRLDCGIELVKNGKAKTILMTGDGGGKYYNEIKVMVNYAEKNGVPEDAVLIDETGYSTYESIYNLKQDRDFDRVIIVTQRYHMYRAVFTARRMGIDAYGVACDSSEYGYFFYRHSREILARVKDFALAFIQPEPETLYKYKINRLPDGKRL